MGFASGEAKVALTEEGGQTILTYDVEANVGGKIAQVGSRLIDMTAKKMADIFFGKFTDEVSPAGLSAPSQSSSVSATKFNKKIIYAVATLVSLGLILLAIY